MKRIIFSFLLWSNLTLAQSKSDSLPILTSSVNDFENILAVHEEVLLQKSIELFYEKSGIGITVVIVNSFEPYDNIFDYSLDMANRLNGGKMLIVLSDKLRKIQIQNHDDILDKLTDEESEAILENYILPKFKEGKYYKGLSSGIAEIKKEF